MRILLFTLLFVTAAARAQSDERLDFVTLGVGASTGTPGNPYDEGFVSLAMDFRVARRTTLVQGGVSVQGAVFGRDGVAEGHVLVGAAWRRGAAVLTAAAGPSVVSASRTQWVDDGSLSSPRPGDFSKGYTAGLHVSAGAAVALVPEVGLGVEVFASANPRFPVAGVRVAAALGRLPRSVVR